ncbi:MAG: hypothetical protein EXR85_07180 [Xanthomonadales bacterium]|nr:hypothetical protein [Xanthomonadales bacterium]
MKPETMWLIIGFGGQALFSARFLIQWISSERAKKSVIPEAFWWCSIGGAMVLLSYAIYRQDPVFILGQSVGFIIYGRNLQLLHHERKRLAALQQDSGPES